MKSALNRRSFLKRSALTAGALSTVRLLTVPNILAAARPGEKLNCVQIGCGGRGSWLANLFAESGLYHFVACADYFQDKVDAVGAKF